MSDTRKPPANPEEPSAPVKGNKILNAQSAMEAQTHAFGAGPHKWGDWGGAFPEVANPNPQLSVPPDTVVPSWVNPWF